MNKKHVLYHILSDYSNMDHDSLADLKEGLQRYPFCQTLQVAYLLNLKKIQEDDIFHQTLPFVAICAADRSHLKKQVGEIDLLVEENMLNHTKSTLASMPIQKRSANSTISELLPKRVKILEKKSLEAAQQQVFNKIDCFLSDAQHQNTELQQIFSSKVVEEELPIHTAQQEKDENDDKIALVEKFLEHPAHMEKPDNNTDYSELEAKIEKDSLSENSELVTETLANLYLKNGLVNQAIAIYSQLSLKFPEKSRYFAKLIEEAKLKK